MGPTLAVNDRHMGRNGSPDANLVGTYLICDSLHDLQTQSAPLLNTATILICAVIWLWLDELINDIPLQR